MISLSAELLPLTLAVIGAVIVVAALLSGLIERSGFPQVAVFLALGAVIGPLGLKLLDAGVHSPLLRVVSTVSLVLVLFTDALTLSIPEVRRNKLLSFLVLGPGTLLSALVIAFIAWGLLGFSPALSAILGAALASTDPVLLRGLLRRHGLDPRVRQTLRLEAGMNDAVLLPVVLVATVVLTSAGGMSGSDWGRMILSMLVLSPMAGLFIGLGGVGALDLARRRITVRRDYESLYSLGIAFAAYAAGEAIHGSGFLTAFFAGLTISALDVELCDCFRDYGETTAELTLLFTFVLFGTSVIWSGLGVVSAITLLFTGLVFLARPLVFIPSLLPAPLTWKNRGLIAWFGPRGLSSLLLVLLPVFGGVPGSEALLPVCCLVVLLSVVLHGFSPSVLLRNPKAAIETIPAKAPEVKITEVPAADPRFTILPSGDADAPALPKDDLISIEDYLALRAAGVEHILLDVRSERDYNNSDDQVPGALRLHPQNAVNEIRRSGKNPETVVIAFCACPEDSTAVRVVQVLRRAGWVNARALRNGWESWKKAQLPLAPKT
ncbi:MAG TPA: cation:proton antiporter [Bryobacteraceae bacterium]|nr:cation:proton antiporter [Bryobacteraceae bacterium]